MVVTLRVKLKKYFSGLSITLELNLLTCLTPARLERSKMPPLINLRSLNNTDAVECWRCFGLHIRPMRMCSEWLMRRETFCLYHLVYLSGERPRALVILPPQIQNITCFDYPGKMAGHWSQKLLKRALNAIGHRTNDSVGFAGTDLPLSWNFQGLVRIHLAVFQR